MTREIKFRVRDRDTKKVIGYECLMPDITNDAWNWAKSFAGIDWEGGVYDAAYHLREQFTGLKDKNGTEIYEGDILRYTKFTDKGFKKTVKWNKNDAGFGLRAHATYEIIGNLFENPELLR